MGILADIGAFANPFGTPSKGGWNLQRGIYINSLGTQTVFYFEEKTKDEPVTNRTGLENISDAGGKRLAVYEYPYLPGQTVADLGRKGETFTFNIKFFGLNYQQRFNDFIDTLLNDSGGTQIPSIVHPVRGKLPVRFREYEFLHRFDEWNAVTIRATFIEDSQSKLQPINIPAVTPDSVLASSLDLMVQARAGISELIFEVSALIKLPNAIRDAMNLRLSTIIGQVSRLLGQLGITYSTSSVAHTLAVQSAGVGGGFTNLNSGTTAQTVNGTTTVSQIPPVFQAGLSPTTQAQVQANISAFANAQTITPQQAIYSANQARTSITNAILEAEANMGNFGYDIMVSYRQLAVQIQTVTEACLASAQQQVKIYVVPRTMSLRQIAQANGLSYNRQNDIEALNSDLPSVNFVPAGTQVAVPAA